MNLEQEKELLQQIHSDPKQFGLLFDLYYKPIFNYILRRVADYELAKDIAAETFLKAYLNINRFAWRNISISSWLYRIASNAVNYYFRNRKLATTSLNELLNRYELKITAHDEYLSEKELFENELKLHDQFIKVQLCLTKLKPMYQEVLSLKYFEKKPVAEIAAILNKKEGTIKSLLSRGTEKLRIMMGNATTWINSIIILNYIQ